MLPTIVIGPWDLLLIAAVSVQATVLAYLYHPRWKALVLTLPIPFTMASLALGRPIDATNILGLGLLLLFTHGVRVLHQRLRLPIVAAIVLSALAYCVAGWALAGVVPPTDAFFWGAGLGSLAVGALLLRLTRPREEPQPPPLVDQAAGDHGSHLSAGADQAGAAGLHDTLPDGGGGRRL